MYIAETYIGMHCNNISILLYIKNLYLTNVFSDNLPLCMYLEIRVIDLIKSQSIVLISWCCHAFYAYSGMDPGGGGGKYVRPPSPRRPHYQPYETLILFLVASFRSPPFRVPVCSRSGTGIQRVAKDQIWISTSFYKGLTEKCPCHLNYIFCLTQTSYLFCSTLVPTKRYSASQSWVRIIQTIMTSHAFSYMYIQWHHAPGYIISIPCKLMVCFKYHHMEHATCVGCEHQVRVQVAEFLR